MSDFITLVRKRNKDGTPGKLEVLVSPDEPAGAHIDAYRPLSHQTVSDDISELRVCRLFDSQRKLTFPTKAEAKAQDEARKQFQAAQGKTNEDAAKRQKEQDKAEREREEAERKKIVTRMNVQHDAIRQVKAT